MTSGMAAWQEQGGRKASYAASVPTAPGGNTDWARAYGTEIRQLIHRQAARAPRSLQAHIGPSEMGEPCARQVVGKMIAEPSTNHVPSLWPAIIGTSVHAWLAIALQDENARVGRQRFLSEMRVTPDPEHPGTTDFYDWETQTTGDWKCLGPTSMAKITRNGPSFQYRVQLLLYWLGCLIAGLPVRRIALVALPRAAATLDGMYVWSHEPGPEDAALVAGVLQVTAARRQLAAAIQRRELTLSDIPITPSSDSCLYCFAGETEVVTRDGIKPIRELAGTSPELLVPRMGKNPGLQTQGDFRQAPVRAFGTQRLWQITLTSRRAEKTIFATAEHRWVLTPSRGSRANPDNKYGRLIHGRELPSERFDRTTQELQPGDRLRSLRAGRPSRTTAMPWAVAQGFVFGDGTRGTGNRPATLSIYDNGKDEALLPFFPFTEPSPYSHTDSRSGKVTAVKHIYGLPRFWKDPPPIRESRTFLLSWLAGYFAADGDVTKIGAVTLCSADQETILFARDVAAVCGIGYSPPRSKWRTGTGTAPTELWSLNLRRRDLPEWFFLIKEHAIRAAQADEEEPRGTYWTVKSVQAIDRVEPVYCATVPGAEMFGLADDLLTGNCPLFRPQAARDGGPGCPGTSIGQGSL